MGFREVGVQVEGASSGSGGWIVIRIEVLRPDDLHFRALGISLGDMLVEGSRKWERFSSFSPKKEENINKNKSRRATRHTAKTKLHALSVNGLQTPFHYVT